MSHADILKEWKLSVVAPCYNESAGLPEFIRRLQAVCVQLGSRYEILLVNDGSRDDTLQVALGIAARTPEVKVINLLRNFGHQAAVTAGLDGADGDAVVLIDSDLQDPPELIVGMVAAWREGADVAYGKRKSRQGETAFKLFTAKIFYRLLRALTKSPIPADTALGQTHHRSSSTPSSPSLQTRRERHPFAHRFAHWRHPPAPARAGTGIVVQYATERDRRLSRGRISRCV